VGRARGDAEAALDAAGGLLAGLLWSPAARAGTYYIWNDWGGTWADAEKTSGNTDDDLMCWAASSSNILEWTRWGKVGGMTNTDQMFAHFQAHFTDQGGHPYYGLDWWFDGTNDTQGWTGGWAQVDVSGGVMFVDCSYFVKQEL